MAAILDAFAPYVKKLIVDMAEGEVAMLLGVSADINKLENNMESLNNFLVDAERRRITDQSVQRWVSKLKDAMYDATDIMDLCQLEADKRKEQKEGGFKRKVPSCFQPLIFCLQNPLFAHKIGCRIMKLNQRLDSIHKEADKFRFNIGLGSDMNLTTTQMFCRRVRMTSEFDESAIVGEKIEMDTKELTQLITTYGKHDIKVVSIVGTGGMGKTTLAQKIFNHKTIQEHFKLKIWLSITQQFDEVELLRTAIEHAGGVHGGAQDKTLLTRTLTNTLSKGRFLLVCDDMWTIDAWSQVLCVPLKNASLKEPGNWVLVTTRFGDLAQRMGASFYQHLVTPIKEADAWSLLKKQLPPSSNNQVVDHLQDVGVEIIKKCGGLPLAIKVVGGLLSTKSQNKREWEIVLNHPAWSTVGLPEDVHNSIYLSYENLSPKLKQCFLYCSLFPKGTKIRRDIIVPMWISEGFIQSISQHDDQLEEIATVYYEELITRNLIEPTEECSITKYECIMHDVVRFFAEFMAREDSHVVQEDREFPGGRNNCLVRRISIGPSNLVFELSILQMRKSARTLIINCRVMFRPVDSLTGFSRLRVLSIKGADSDMLVDSLFLLMHLRYFRLEESDISRLPDDIHKLKFLQHIILINCQNFGHLPGNITKLVHLRAFNLVGSSTNILIPKGFDGLTNLRSLFGFPVHMNMDGDGGLCSLEEIGPLSQLRKLTLYGPENVLDSSLAGKAMISRKEHLQYLCLRWTSTNFMEFKGGIEKQQQQQAVEELLDKLRPPSNLQHLIITGYVGSELPNWMMLQNTWAFKSLMILRLENMPCCTQLPDSLCRLPSLEVLQIKDAPAIKSVRSEFQSPSLASHEMAAFPSLTNLWLKGMCGWEKWEWEELGEDEVVETMAMPTLRRLTIDNCKLRCLPPGLACSKRIALTRLHMYNLTILTSIENFPSVVELEVFDCPILKRINCLSRLQKIRIFRCPNMEVLEEVPSLDSMEMMDDTMDTVPEFLRTVSPRYLKLTCCKKLSESLLTGRSSEYHKIGHIMSHTIMTTFTEDED